MENRGQSQWSNAMIPNIRHLVVEISGYGLMKDDDKILETLVLLIEHSVYYSQTAFSFNYS